MAGAFVLRIVCCILCVYLASKKHRHLLAWAIASLIFPIISVIVILILPAKNPTESRPFGGYEEPPRRTYAGGTGPTRSAAPQNEDDDDLMDQFSSAVKKATKKTRKVATYCKGCGAPLVGYHDQFISCPYCGTNVRLNEDEE